jgi:hypothetical protein
MEPKSGSVRGLEKGEQNSWNRIHVEGVVKNVTLGPVVGAV